MAVPFGVSMLW